MARRIDVQWHRNNKALDVVVGEAHITLIPDEVALLAEKATSVLASPPPDHRVPLSEARSKVGRPAPSAAKVLRQPPRTPCHRKGVHDEHSWTDRGEKRRCPGKAPR